VADCITNDRLNGLINAADPRQNWLDHIEVCAPNSKIEADSLGSIGVSVTITEVDPNLFYITPVGNNFILEAALSRSQAEAVCDAIGWVY